MIILKGAEIMDRQTIWTVTNKFAKEAKEVFGDKLNAVILFDSCAREDFEPDSDIDIMVLPDLPQDEINIARRRFSSHKNILDMDYDVLIAPVYQSSKVFEKYLPVSCFYQKVQREGVRIA